jgi:DNA-binding MarR family transcriptional regulator
MERNFDPMTPGGNVDQLLSTLRDTIIGTVRRDGPDLSARQFGIMLICYLDEGPHTIRGLAATLEISKPAITRSLDRLVELDLAKRGPDARDGRSVLVLRTMEGTAFMSDLRSLLVAGHKASGGGGGGGTKASAPRRVAG